MLQPFMLAKTLRFSWAYLCSNKAKVSPAFTIQIISWHRLCLCA